VVAEVRSACREFKVAIFKFLVGIRPSKLGGLFIWVSANTGWELG
jgi:hypothetical protein